MEVLKAGDKVPQFKTVDQNGNAISLSQLEGKKTILFFYPRANTPGCTAEACNLKDNYQELKAAGFQLIGVSGDNPKKQKNFADKYKLPFTLLADEDKVVIDAFGVWGPKKFQGREYDGIHRTTFIVDEKGVVEQVIGKVKTKDHAAQILACL
jgi:peroxiredoxin Q/BCP